MGSHVKRIVEENLRSRRFIVGVIQAHESVPKEWDDNAARIHLFFVGAG